VTNLDWTAPGAHEVSPDVYRIPLPLPDDSLRAVNVYAIRDDNALTLIDGGWAIAGAREQLAARLATVGIPPNRYPSTLGHPRARDHRAQDSRRRQVGRGR
jgi:hypothetical protein